MIRIGDETAEIDIVNAIVVEEVSLSDDEIGKGDKVEITARITNNDDKEREVDIKIDNETVRTITVQPGTQNYTHEFEIDEKGTHEIKIGDQTAEEVNVKSKDTPGFGILILLLSISIIIAFRYNKGSKTT